VRRQLRATVRLVSWWPMVIVIVASSVLVRRGGLSGDAAELILAAAVAIGLSPIFGDASATTLASSPTSRRARACARLALAVPAAAISWVAARALAFQSLPHAEPLLRLPSVAPSREAWLTMMTFGALVLAIEATVTVRGAIAGMTGATTAIMIAIALPFLPASLAFVPIEHHLVRWVTALAIALALLWAATSDPGRANTRAGARFASRAT